MGVISVTDTFCGFIQLMSVVFPLLSRPTTSTLTFWLLRRA